MSAASALAWKAANPERHKANNEAYRKRNRERLAAKQKEWRENNTETAYRGVREWQKRNPVKVREYAFKNRAMRANAPGTATASQIESRWSMFGHRCWMCGDPASHTDHVIPLARGGSNWPANLRPACAPCNHSKGAKLVHL